MWTLVSNIQGPTIEYCRWSGGGIFTNEALRPVVAGTRNSAPRLPKGPVPSMRIADWNLSSNFLSALNLNPKLSSPLRFEFMGLMAEGGRARKRKGAHLGVMQEPD